MGIKSENLKNREAKTEPESDTRYINIQTKSVEITDEESEHFNEKLLLEIKGTQWLKSKVGEIKQIAQKLLKSISTLER